LSKLDARRSFYSKPRKKKGPKNRLPAEVEFRTELAIILRIAGYETAQIAASIGESKDTIKRWLREPKNQVRYENMMTALASSALNLLETYSIEAVQTIVTVMRTSENEKFIMEAAREILDRGGLPKMSRSISEQTIQSRHETEVTDTTLLEKLRAASPEVQEKAAQAVEELETLLAQHAEDSDGSAK
jgi:hypothetical protein